MVSGTEGMGNGYRSCVMTPEICSKEEGGSSNKELEVAK